MSDKVNRKILKYIDEYGDTWIRICEFYVKRLKDNNIGLWQNGRGLYERQGE